MQLIHEAEKKYVFCRKKNEFVRRPPKGRENGREAERGKLLSRCFKHIENFENILMREK